MLASHIYVLWKIPKRGEMIGHFQYFLDKEIEHKKTKNLSSDFEYAWWNKSKYK